MTWNKIPPLEDCATTKIVCKPCLKYLQWGTPRVTDRPGDTETWWRRGRRLSRSAEDFKIPQIPLSDLTWQWGGRWEGGTQDKIITANYRQLSCSDFYLSQQGCLMNYKFYFRCSLVFICYRVNFFFSLFLFPELSDRSEWVISESVTSVVVTYQD